MERRILVPLAVGAVDDAALTLVRAEARALDAAVVLLHVLPRGALPPDHVTPAEARARAYLDGVAAALRAVEIAAHPLVRAGDPVRTIVEEARTRRAALVVLGREQNPVRFGITRPVAARVIRQVTCPVILTPGRTGARRSGGVLPLPNPGPLAPRPLGIRAIPVVRVVGSADRAAELRADFRPHQPYPEDERRFQAVREALRRGERLPPIDVFKLGFGYYVRDGHHRVAAARALGLPVIAARVTALVPLGDRDAARALTRRVQFEQETGLLQVGANRAESYDWLQEAIRGYAAAHGLTDLPAAARRWSEEVFFPLWRRIRAEGLTCLFPGERPADLLARLIAWQVDRTGTACPSSWEGALAAFTAPETDGGAA